PWGITWRATAQGGELRGENRPTAEELRGGRQYQDDGSDPVLNIAAAAGHMRLAAQLAADLGEQLSEAQNAIAQQGYRD
ncbi:hypothetical protein, partial [Sinomonas atrocyanea]|uniref:hypothetical protein n=1 Tax=Sinomonas atrocyanea TaxID=37927 RepID=UPI00286684E4